MMAPAMRVCRGQNSACDTGVPRAVPLGRGMEWELPVGGASCIFGAVSWSLCVCVMKAWAKWLVVGILSGVFGLFVLANPVAASVSVTIMAGLLFAASGLFQILVGVDEDGLWAKLVGLGIGFIMLLLGVSLMFNPLEGVLSLTLLVTILFAASGVARLITAFQMRATVFFWPMLVSGALTILLAGYIGANFFDVAPALLGVLLGIELLVNGIALVILAFFLRKLKQRLQG